MSAVTQDRALHPDSPLHEPAAVPAPPGVPFARLLRVELRKCVDTQAGRWLLVALAAAAVFALVAFLIWGGPSDPSFTDLFSLALFPLVLLFPVLGIMTATAEWSQRSGLVTFTQEPRRGRVVAAKSVAASALGVAVTVVTAAAAALALLVWSLVKDVSPVWDLRAVVIGGVLLALTLFVLQGVALGFALRSTALALVGTLVVPLVWTLVGPLFSGLRDLQPWLDLQTVTTPLMEGAMTTTDWKHLGTSVMVWVMVPFVLGFWRVTRGEVK